MGGCGDVCAELLGVATSCVGLDGDVDLSWVGGGGGPADGEVGGWGNCDGCVCRGIGEVECVCEGDEEGEEGEDGWGWHVHGNEGLWVPLPAVGVLAT